MPSLVIHYNNSLSAGVSHASVKLSNTITKRHRYCLHLTGVSTCHKAPIFFVVTHVAKRASIVTMQGLQGAQLPFPGRKSCCFELESVFIIIQQRVPFPAHILSLSPTWKHAASAGTAPLGGWGHWNHSPGLDREAVTLQPKKKRAVINLHCASW